MSTYPLVVADDQLEGPYEIRDNPDGSKTLLIWTSLSVTDDLVDLIVDLIAQHLTRTEAGRRLHELEQRAQCSAVGREHTLLIARVVADRARLGQPMIVIGTGNMIIYRVLSTVAPPTTTDPTVRIPLPRQSSETLPVIPPTRDGPAEGNILR